MMSNVSIICSDTTCRHEICHTSRLDKNPVDHTFWQMFVYTAHRMTDSNVNLYQKRLTVMVLLSQQYGFMLVNSHNLEF
jgi:hypothetical protein